MKKSDPLLKGRVLARVHADEIVEASAGTAESLPTRPGGGFPDDIISQDTGVKLREDG